MKIKTKLAAVMFIMCLLGVFSITTLLLARAEKSIVEVSEKYAFSTAYYLSSHMEQFLEIYWNVVENTAAIMESYEELPPSQRRHYFNAMLRSITSKHEDLLGAWVNFEPDVLEGNDSRFAHVPGSDPETGRFIPYWVRTSSGIDVELLVDYETPGDGDYTLLARNNNRTTLLNPFTYEIEGKDVLMTTIATPIRSPSGRVLGVMGVDISIDRIQEISQRYKPFGDGDVIVVANNGVIAGHFAQNQIGKNIAESEIELLGTYKNNFMNAVAEGLDYSYNYHIPHFDKEMYVFLTPVSVGESPWGLVIIASKKTVLSAVDDMKNSARNVSVVVLIIAVLVAMFLGRAISRPVVKVANALKDISEGGGDLTSEITVRSRDELRHLAEHFNKLMLTIKVPMCEIKGVINALTYVSKELQTISTRLMDGSKETVDKSNFITNITNGIVDNISSVAASSQEVSAAASSVAQSSEQMSNSIHSITLLIDELSKGVAQIADNANNISNVSESANITAQNAGGKMTNLEKAVDEIGNATQSVRTIARKTNLLALNASVEAARAGDVGKGFAVVAGEVKQLADQSAVSAGDITEKVVQIQNETKDVTTTFQEVSNIILQVTQIVKDVTELTEHQAESSDRMSHDAKEANNEAKNVAVTIGEVAQGSQLIANNANEVSNGIAEIGQNMTVMNRIANEDAKRAIVVHDISDKLAEMTVNLRDIANKFQLGCASCSNRKCVQLMKSLKEFVAKADSEKSAQ